MIRLGLVLLLLFGLSALREPYREHTVPKHVSGDKLTETQAGLVTFNGTVLKATMSHEGGKVLTMQVDNQQVIAFIGPQLGIGLPHTGSYCSITGKMLGAGAVTLQAKEDFKLLVPSIIAYEPSNRPGEVNQRVEFHVDRVFKLPRVSAKRIRSIQFVTNGRVYSGLTNDEWITDVIKSSILKGYKLPSGQFMVEAWS